MSSVKSISRFVLLSVLSLLFVACAGQKEPAQKLISDIQSTVAAASAEAEKYVPDQLADVQSKLSTLKASFDQKNYDAVVANGPAVLTAAQSLATAAAAKKDEVLKTLNDNWTALSGELPADVAALQNRLEFLGKKSNKKQAKGIDLDAAKSGLADVNALWSKAQAAFAANNLDEAVSTAKDVKSKVQALAGQLKVDLPAAGAPAAGSSP
jgi:hypothetical protein